MENKIKTEKVKHHFESEQDIFKYLNMEYREPWERTDSRAFKEITEKKALPQPEKKKKLIIEEINLSEFTKQFRKNGTNNFFEHFERCFFSSPKQGTGPVSCSCITFISPALAH